MIRKIMLFIAIAATWSLAQAAELADIPNYRHYNELFSSSAENPVKTLLHCQVNFRASTFSFLYRVAIQGVPTLEAKNDLDSVWEPNEIWFRFIRTVLDNYGLAPACLGCNWGANEFID